MAVTYEPIATATLGSAASEIVFSSIPATYTDLRIVLTGTFASAGTNPAMRFNGNTASNYSVTEMYGTGDGNGSTGTSSFSFINLVRQQSILNTTTPVTFNIDIFSYAGSTFKTCLVSGSSDINGSGWTNRLVGLWRQTAAINAIRLYPYDSTNMNAGTTATLYGILKA
jgi:hypothetical protein